MTLEFHILLVEDSPSDAALIERALREAAIPHRLTIATDGCRALDFLRGPDPEPDLVLLDLNLPGFDGWQVLDAIKSDAELCRLPVVVLTTSRRDEDIARTYQVGANTYFQKPEDFAAYGELVSLLHRYWHQTALRPPRRRRAE
jgi:CheY-like chemotaxis protein